MLRLRCGSGASCRGTLRLVLRRHGGRLVTVAKRHYHLRAGQTARLRMRLWRRGRRLLKRRHRLRLYGTAVDFDGTAAQASFVVRMRRHHSHKHRRRR